MGYNVYQQLIIEYTDKQGRDLSGLSLRVDYWDPSDNNSDTPSGTLPAGYLSAEDDVLTITIPTGFFVTKAGSAALAKGEWKFQIFETTTNIGWEVVSAVLGNRGL